MTTGREKFKKNKGIISVFVKLFKLLPKSILLFIWNCTANHSQILFVGLRYIILKSRIKSCGDNVKIGTNVHILGWEKLSIGTNVSIHSNCYIEPIKETVQNHISLYNPFYVDGFVKALENLYLNRLEKDCRLKEKTIKRFDHKKRFDEFYNILVK